MQTNRDGESYSGDCNGDDHNDNVTPNLKDDEYTEGPEMMIRKAMIVVTELARLLAII